MAGTGRTGPGSPPVIAPLTGLRALAALAVVAFHFREPLFALLPSAHALDRWLMFGFLGVDVFFVLSGFVISYNYAERLAVLSGRGYGSFMRARFARVYPVHLVTFLLAAALVGWFAARGARLDVTAEHTALGFVGNLLMLQAFPGVDPWNGASWSVSCEAVAYVFFPLVAGLLLRLGRTTALALAATVALLQFLVIEALSAVPGFFPYNWVRLAGEFALGCLLWAAWRHGFGGRRVWDAVALLCAGIVLWLFSRAQPWVAIPFLAVFVVATAGSRGVVRAVLGSRPMQWGGRVSYSLFLVHIPVIVVMFAVLPPQRYASAPPVLRAVVLAAYAAAMLTAAAAAYYGVEEPCRAWIRGRRAPAATRVDNAGPSALTPASGSPSV